MNAAADFTFHLASPAGEGAIALIEIYGAGGESAVRACFKSPKGALPRVGRARYGDFVQPHGDVIDDVVVQRIPAAAMWSGREAWVVELHGGQWQQAQVRATLRRVGGVEQSLREVLVSSVREQTLDAIQAAAYECLVEARSEKAARFFLRQHRGELSRLVRTELDQLTAETLERLASRAAPWLERSRAARHLAAPLRVLIAGRPNAGKSTLFNRLVEEERAVVSDVAGTTRDVLVAQIDLFGYPVVLHDGAGLRPEGEGDLVEELGIRKVIAGEWDAVIHLVRYPWRLDSAEIELLQRVPAGRRLMVASGADLAVDNSSDVDATFDLKVSAHSGEGVDELRQLIAERWICSGLGADDEVPCAPFSDRQVALFQAAITASASREDDALDATRAAFLQCLRSSWP